MTTSRTLLSPLTILMAVIVLAALATWLVPAGKYHRLSFDAGATSFSYETADSSFHIPFTQQTLDSLHINIPLINFSNGAIKKPVSVPGTYARQAKHSQGPLSVLQAPIKGFYESLDVIFFVLVLGAFMQVFNQTGAMVKGITALSKRMRGRESWLIIILTFLFSLGGSSFGMAEEGLVFYPLLIPVFLAAGYDLLVPVAVIFGGTQLGTLSSFSNPFSTIIASNAAGVNWGDGISERLAIFLISTSIFTWFIVRYARRIKKDPSTSYVRQVQGEVHSNFEIAAAEEEAPSSLSVKTKLLLVNFFACFSLMIYGVIFLEWWLTEMTTVFLAGAIVTALLYRMKEGDFIKSFVGGAGSLLGVALIIGTARGVTIVLNDGGITGTIIFHAAQLTSSMPPALFIIAMMVVYLLFTLFISSSSGMAVLTMPIMGALAILVNVPGREVVNAYLFGMGVMGFLTPTGLILPALAITNLGFKTWWKFIAPFIIILCLLCITWLSIGIYFT